LGDDFSVKDFFFHSGYEIITHNFAWTFLAIVIVLFLLLLFILFLIIKKRDYRVLHVLVVTSIVSLYAVHTIVFGLTWMVAEEFRLQEELRQDELRARCYITENKCGCYECALEERKNVTNREVQDYLDKVFKGILYQGIK